MSYGIPNFLRSVLLFLVTTTALKVFAHGFFMQGKGTLPVGAFVLVGGFFLLLLLASLQIFRRCPRAAAELNGWSRLLLTFAMLESILGMASPMIPSLRQML